MFHRERSCTQKVPHTEKQARTKAEQLSETFREDYVAYPCPYHNGEPVYHVGRSREAHFANRPRITFKKR